MNRSTTFFHTKPGSLGGTKPGSYWVEAVVNQMSCLKKTIFTGQISTEMTWHEQIHKKMMQMSKVSWIFTPILFMLLLGFSPNLSSHQDPRALRSLSSISRHRAVPHRCFDTAASSRKPAHGDRNGNSPQGCWITPSRSRQSQRKRAMSATKPRWAHTLRPFCCHFWLKVSWECLSLWVQSNKMQLCYSKTRVNHPKIYHKWMV